ncbi:hypothetical protein SAMN05216215_1011177 [Saccharopolyspora shandongensis]|uniref:Uncharacterized protein n=2 Tax=Saccharopolyspora shandongensis TaxID=418495 RepID=A0A1H3C594_9PSEU|nr:hypothetical protein SAMN05216215_1011177 [Saccharopolyspora shandongensis]
MRRPGIMLGVADQHESPRPEPGPNLPEKSRTAEVVDAEVVDSEVVETDAPARPQQSADDAEFRQYQQFLEFQKFREWQQSQGGDVAVPPPAVPPAAKPQDPKKAWWKRALGLLRYKLVRRLIYWVLALLLALWLISYLINQVTSFFGGSSGNGDGTSNGGVPVDSVPVKSENPQQAVRGVYNWLRGPNPERTCDLFSDDGKSGFFQAHGASDCATAARQLHSQITDPNAYANPKFDHNAVTEIGSEAQVLGCRVRVNGGPRLGTFKLTKQPDGGWTISAYALQADDCDR